MAALTARIFARGSDLREAERPEPLHGLAFGVDAALDDSLDTSDSFSFAYEEEYIELRTL